MTINLDEQTMARKEEWRPIPEYDGYFASSLGRIKSVSQGHKKTENILKPSPVANGYWRVTLYKNRKAKPTRVHAAVALAFHGERPDGYHVEHIDHDKANNAPSNLRYCTPQENYSRGQKDGIYPSGAKHPMRKLTEEQVIEILSLSNMHREDVAKMYGVTKWTITEIRSGRSWNSASLAQYRKRVG